MPAAIYMTTLSNQLPPLMIVLTFSVPVHGIVLRYRLGQGAFSEARDHPAIPFIDLVSNLPTTNVAPPTRSAVPETLDLTNELEASAFEHTI